LQGHLQLLHKCYYVAYLIQRDKQHGNAIYKTGALLLLCPLLCSCQKLGLVGFEQLAKSISTRTKRQRVKNYRCNIGLKRVIGTWVIELLLDDGKDLFNANKRMS
jgi:hypothetical protein